VRDPNSARMLFPSRRNLYGNKMAVSGRLMSVRSVPTFLVPVRQVPGALVPETS
jgi:hypothetical protein